MTTLQEQARAAARSHIRPGDPLPVLLRALADKIDADQAQLKELDDALRMLAHSGIGTCRDEGMSETEATGLREYRVWPDGTVQESEGEPAFSWLSDDFLTVRASSEADAIAEVARIMDTELDAPR